MPWTLISALGAAPPPALGAAPLPAPLRLPIAVAARRASIEGPPRRAR